MSRQDQFSWMVNRKGFIKLVGGEYELMHKAGGTVLFKFYLSSVIILLIAVLSFVSIFYAIRLLFHVLLVEIMLSTFLSLLFVLLFIFIVNTFTKETRQRKLFNLSNITRLGFVMFIGFIISKPIEALWYKDTIEADIQNHKTELVKDHSLKINQLFDRDLARLIAEKNKYTSMGLPAGIPQIDQQLSLIAQKKNDLAAVSALRIEQGAYFIYRIKIIAGKYPGAWLISLFIVAFFLLPVYLIYSISSDEEYFKTKKEQEKRMIERAYKAFTKKYPEIFLAVFNVKLEFYSKYEDPPFNTLIKKAQVCRSVNDFHERYTQA